MLAHHKAKSYKKTFHNKKRKVHPHLECVQNEIVSLEEELHELKELEKQGPLTSEQVLDKQIKTACLERYQATFEKLTDSTMANKLRSFQDTESKHKEEGQVMFLLQFFYLIRLGQLGLFTYVDMATTATLKAMTEVCDQLVGAAAYCAKDPKSRAYKRNHLFTTLKKLEVGSDDEISDNVTFKDLKDIMQHIWDHTTLESETIEKPGRYAVLAFDNMVGEIKVNEKNLNHNTKKQEELVEENNKVMEFVIEPVHLPPLEDESDEDLKSIHSSSTDNWRNRDKGRGRGRGRGNKMRGRGRGTPRGRGRGKGRHDTSPPLKTE